ncbi:uncharacterized protein LOC124692832 isoform X2 [Lolium rigidum]|uniref:uncharacterized protein LOC124692832 isoform X2 n=1 Tax=Lolium rigidum TaxID=89674 RepID=UPI001F5C634F|nr:uncharacterized protein LOC124692832 isoform X2 [Lolium rigidum]
MLQCLYTQRRWAHRRGGFVTGGTGWSQKAGPVGFMGAKKSEWWAVDGELHEVGEGVPHRERFAIPRDNLPNRRRKQMRQQFMRRTRLVLKDSEHETWCKKYMEMYQELRENWERLYWDEGYTKKIAEDRTNYDSAEEDDLDFSPYRRRSSSVEPNKDFSSGGSRQGGTWESVTQIRDKFEYDRERRMRERAFAPMNMENNFGQHNSKHNPGPHGGDFVSQTGRSFQLDLSSRNQHDSNARNISSFRNQHDSNARNISSFRNQHDSNARNISSFGNQQYPNS